MKDEKEFLEKATQIFKIVEGMPEYQWCKIAHTINQKYSSVKGKVIIPSADECVRMFKLDNFIDD